jgi:uncharacterized oxidoreductase
MVSQFLPHLKKQQSAVIVNVSSGLAFVPMAISPVYSASKAGLHAYTQALRMQLKDTNIVVLELAPPVTDTPLFRRSFTGRDVGGVKPMTVKTVVAQAIAGIEKGTPEVHPGLRNLLKLMSRAAPNFIFRRLNRSID